MQSKAKQTFFLFFGQKPWSLLFTTERSIFNSSLFYLEFFPNYFFYSWMTSSLLLSLLSLLSLLLLSLLLLRQKATSYVLAQGPWGKYQTEHLIKYKASHIQSSPHTHKYEERIFISEKRKKHFFRFFPDALLRISFHVGNRRGLEFGTQRKKRE